MANFSEQEKVSLLLKKFFGKPSTNQTLPFYSEPSIDARPGVFPSQIYSEEIPDTAPADNTFNSGSGKASMTQGTKSISSENSSIIYYKKWQLVQVTNGNDQSFKGPPDGGSITEFADAGGGQVTVTSNNHYLSNGNSITISGTTNYNGDYSITNVTTNTFQITETWVSDDGTGTYVNNEIPNILAGSIPFNYDSAGGYAVTLEDSASNQIFDGTGEWAIDTDAGILTFYHHEDVSSIVNSSLLPYLSFFRYRGNKGFQTVSSIWTSSTNEIYFDDDDKTVLINAQTSTSDYALEVAGSRDVKIHNNLIAQDVTSLSDKSLKKNIRKLKYGLKELKKINPVFFDWIQENKPKDNIGLIAQEVEKIIPEIVYKDKYTGLCSIRYDKLSMVLINSVKDMNTKYNKLIRKVNKQEKTIKSLVNRLEILENNLS